MDECYVGNIRRCGLKGRQGLCCCSQGFQGLLGGPVWAEAQVLKRGCPCGDMGRSTSERGHEYKGPEAGEGLACSTDSEEATEAGVVSKEGQGEGWVRWDKLARALIQCEEMPREGFSAGDPRDDLFGDRIRTLPLGG